MLGQIHFLGTNQNNLQKTEHRFPSRNQAPTPKYVFEQRMNSILGVRIKAIGSPLNAKTPTGMFLICRVIESQAFASYEDWPRKIAQAARWRYWFVVIFSQPTSVALRRVKEGPKKFRLCQFVITF